MSPARPRPSPGLARERTVLAWNRTSVGLLAFSALLAHVALREGRLGLALTCLVTGAGAGVVWRLGRTRRRASSAVPPAVGRLLVGLVLACAVLAVVAAVTPP